MTTLAVFRACTFAIVQDPVLADLTSRHLAVLLVLHDGEPEQRTVRSLAALLNVSKSTITRIFDRLTELGFVHRVDDPKNRRSLFGEILPKGRALVERLAAAGAESLRRPT